MIYQVELVRLSNDNGEITEHGKTLLEMVLKCTFDKNGSWWDQAVKDPNRKKFIEEDLGCKV